LVSFSVATSLRWNVIRWFLNQAFIRFTSLRLWQV
jgi:hypothetical protein